MNMQYTKQHWRSCFIQWLAHKGILEEWMNEVIDVNSRATSLQLLNKGNNAEFFQYSHKLLLCSFQFYATFSGEDYWHKYSSEWQQLVQSN